jgi:hypothetical protein
MSPRFRISTLSMLSWLPKSSVQSAEQDANIRYDCLLFELSSNHVREYLKSPVRVKAEAIMGLDPVLVDNSQTSKRFKTISEVLSVPNLVQNTKLARFIDTYGGTANVYIA